ncbi:MAG: energy-coupling factor ABC transporter ATP-binding protein [Chloroflexota bacterium]
MTIALEEIGYRYAGATRPALLDIDLELHDGEVVGLAGASEAGKTTLCLVVSGLAPRTVGGQIRGRIMLDGENVDAWPMHRLSQHIGIGFQNPSTQLSQVTDSVFEEVAFGPMNLALPRDEVIDRSWSALETLRIAGLAARDPRRLSGGQQQLVAMAGLLAMQPAHLVLDEPTAQLDPAGTRLVADAIDRLAADGASILIAEQKSDLLASICARIVVLDDGHVALIGPADEVLADARLLELGVTEPSAGRLQRAAAREGVDSVQLAEALADG